MWVQFQRAIFLSKSRLALPNMSLFQNLIFATLPSTGPDEYGSVSPLKTAAWSRSRPLAKACRWGQVVGADGGDPGVEAVAVQAGDHLGELLNVAAQSVQVGAGGPYLRELELLAVVEVVGRRRIQLVM
jgi:hypothetical protein